MHFPDLSRLTAYPLAAPPADRVALERQRDSRLRRLIAHAWKQVPFIHDRLKTAGLTPAAITTARDLLRLPTVGKGDYQRAGLGQTLAGNVRPERLVDRATSGSTGERMPVKRTWFEERLLNGFRWRALRDYGLGRRERVAVINFYQRNDPLDNQTPMRLAQAVGLFGHRIFDGLAVNGLAADVARFNPQGLSGMTSAIARLADLTIAERISWRPRFVVSTGELLTEPLRARIAQWDVPLYDLYGSNELNLIAWQCPHGADTYHVCDDAHVIDVLGADGHPVAVGEWGEVVATSLFSYAMPMIRHRLGDVAVRGPDRCPCGAAFSTLLAIRGRTFDSFDLGDGRLRHPYELINALKPHFGWVLQFEMAQSGRSAIEFRVIPNGQPMDVEAMAAAGRLAIGETAEFSVKLVEAIDPGPSGKLRVFVPWEVTPRG
jgi:phenylacetate-CoA ligase